MPGLPAAGGWGGSNRTLGISMEGFSEEEIAKAVDFCDNDKVKTLKYLAKLKAKGGAYNWKPQLEQRLDSIEPQVRGLCKKLLDYDNVPIKQKAFVNFAKNSLALNRQPHLAEKMWEAMGDLLRKPTQESGKQAATKSETEEKMEIEKEDDEKKRKAEEADGDDDGKKKKKKKKSEKKGEDEDEEKEEAESNQDKKEKKKKKKEKQAAASQGDDEEEEEEKPKEKKKKAKAEEEDEEEDEEKEDKKKKAKKAKKAAEKEEEEEEDDDDESAKKKKKKEKKEKKRKEREEKEAQDAEEEVEEPAKEDKKKDKKRKEGRDGAAAGASGRRFDFYAETAATRNLPAAKVDAYREEIGLKLENCGLNPILAFADAPFDEELLECTKGFEKPTAIQAQCWPICLAGQDLVGIAATGSGKTLSFGLPGLTHIRRLNKHKTKQVAMLVLAPTRELAMQSAVVLEAAGKPCGVRTACIYGGVSKHEQRGLLKGGVHVVVATPGRLLDFMEEGAIDVSGVSYLVLDEADRMLDLGFEKDIRRIIGQCGKERQTLMFSATWPVSIQGIAAEFLSNPARVTVGSEELSANHRVKQVVEVVEPQVKERRLLDLLKKYHTGKNRVLIFVLYKKEADRVHSLVERGGFKVNAIHGDRSQEMRTAAMDKFKSAQVPLLIATDVAARGLDIPDVEYVINYTFPLTTEDYVHRIGRTGRAGKEGVSHTLFTQHDKARAGELINVLREAKQNVPEDLMKFGTHVKKKESKLYGAHFKEVDMSQKATKKTFDDSDDE